MDKTQLADEREMTAGKCGSCADVIRVRIGFNLCVAPSKHVSSLFGIRGNLERDRG